MCGHDPTPKLCLPTKMSPVFPKQSFRHNTSSCCGKKKVFFLGGGVGSNFPFLKLK